jgi:hypothetical protein
VILRWLARRLGFVRADTESAPESGTVATPKAVEAERHVSRAARHTRDETAALRADRSALAIRIRTNAAHGRRILGGP